MRTLSFIVLIPAMLLGYQNCGAFSSNSASSLSSSCLSQKVTTPFQKSKFHVSKAWFKGVRKASHLGNQLVVTVNVQCLLDSNLAKSFMGHHLDSSKIPSSMKKYAFAVDFPGNINEELIQSAVESNPCILGVTEQTEVKMVQFQSAATTVTDPLVPDQEYLDSLNFDGSLQLRNVALQKVTVAVVDTGINYNHPDLNGQMWSGSNGERGYNWVAGNNDPLDDDGHGTHVAGIIAATSNNAVGISGIASNQVELMAVKVLDQSGGGNIQNVYNGIKYAIDNGADIINLSIEAQGESPLIEQGVLEAIHSGVVVVMAAGNAGQQITNDNIFAPAYLGPYFGAISVSSLDSSNGDTSTFSNFDNYFIDMAAPGSHDTFNGLGILSTYGNDYLRIMGTSQAAPMVAGAAALLISYLKTENIPYTAPEIENWIKDSGKTASPSLRNIIHGGDVLNLGALSSSTLNRFQSVTTNRLPSSQSSGSRRLPTCQ